MCSRRVEALEGDVYTPGTVMGACYAWGSDGKALERGEHKLTVVEGACTNCGRGQWHARVGPAYWALHRIQRKQRHSSKSARVIVTNPDVLKAEISDQDEREQYRALASGGPVTAPARTYPDTLVTTGPTTNAYVGRDKE